MFRVSIEFYTTAQVILTFWLVHAYDLLEDRCTIDVIITKFSSCILKWRNVFKNKVIFYVIGQRKHTKKSCRGIEQVQEAGRTKQGFQ